MEFLEKLTEIICGDGLLFGNSTEKIIGYALCVIIPYLLGSINFAVLISKLKFKEDIRNFGSGNAGMTNMARTYGKSAAAATFFLDASKAVVSVILGYLLLPANIGAHIACICCMIGHAYPIYYKFKGGKGVTVAAFSVLLIDPIFCLILIAVFAITVACSKYISLGSILGASAYALLYPIFAAPQHIVQLSAPFVVALLIIYWHRSNIKRLLNGEEKKFSFAKKK